MGKYDGMTVNERLGEADLFDAWDKAAKSRNRARMIEILAQVELADQASEIADAVLNDPKRYGF